AAVLSGARDLRQLVVDVDLGPRPGIHVDRARLIAGEAELDPVVLPRSQVEVVGIAVEVVGGPDDLAIQVNASALRRDVRIDDGPLARGSVAIPSAVPVPIAIRVAVVAIAVGIGPIPGVVPERVVPVAETDADPDAGTKVRAAPEARAAAEAR